ncbi:MAG: orotate phosphoribosyltransferase [Candidatus Altiarchaeota archaeon]|nr:orotate phosphoribosyltransferase [Candidatus Altiarchaeota archaeon]
MDARETAAILLDANALKFNVEKPYVFASGIKSPVYMDCRILMSNVGKRRMIVESMVGVVSSLDFDVVAGTASAGIPWASWLSESVSKPMVYVRKAEKEHGRGKKIEGTIPDGASTLLVEDLVSTGMSSLAAVQSLRNEGAKVSECVSIFQYGMPEAISAFKTSAVKLHSLSNFKVACEVALENKYLNKADASKALEWMSNPRGWSK